MGRQLIIDVDTGEQDTIGHIPLEDIIGAHAGCLSAILVTIGQHIGWTTAENLGAEICATIGKTSTNKNHRKEVGNHDLVQGGRWFLRPP